VRVTIARWAKEVTLVRGRRHSPEQIVRKLREADRLLAEGADLDAVCRHLEVSVQTYQRWRSQYKAMRPEDVARLKQLEKENARLKRMVAEQALDIDMLREVSRGNF
jgi:putative transposase